MPDELKVFFGAMLPIGELRLAVPLAIRESDLSVPVVFVLAVAGNLLPVPFIIAALRGAARASSAPLPCRAGSCAGGRNACTATGATGCGATGSSPFW